MQNGETNVHLISFISNDLFSSMVCFRKFPRVVAYCLSKVFDSCCLAQQLFKAIVRVFLGHYMFFMYLFKENLHLS